MKKLLIIKVGGSVVTDKSTDQPTPRLEVIQNITEQISELYKSQEYQIIFVHGAGSFGHPIAKKYNTYKGAKTDKQKIGVCLTHEKMMELNLLILNNLLKNLTPAVVIQPHSIITQKNSKIETFDLEFIKNYLNQDYVPVLYGDTVLDSEWGSSIISGDTLVSYLSQQLEPDKIIFLSDVDGIFDSNPKQNPQAKLIPYIDEKNYDTVIESLESHHTFDISGEMKGKLISIHTFLLNKEIVIMNGLKKDQLCNFFKNNVPFTRIKFK